MCVFQDYATNIHFLANRRKLNFIYSIVQCVLITSGIRLPCMQFLCTLFGVYIRKNQNEIILGKGCVIILKAFPSSNSILKYRKCFLKRNKILLRKLVFSFHLSQRIFISLSRRSGSDLNLLFSCFCYM